MSGAHTPGPWHCYADLPSADPDWHIVTNASRMRVLANVHIEPGNETDAANARLVTAAPDLLEALIAAKRAMWDWSRGSWTLTDFKNFAVIQQIDAALALARSQKETNR